MEGMKHADDVADLAKVGKIAERNGSSTLAILKTLGRGAIAIGRLWIGRAHIRRLRIDELEVGRVIRLDDPEAGARE